MSDNVQKYNNWRTITESDYVTMFIKTWFTYISALRAICPEISIFTADGKPKGDRPFLNAYKTQVLPYVSRKIKIESFSKSLFEFYPSILALAFFVLFVMSDKEQFQGTAIAYGGIWQRLTMHCCYVPFIAFIIEYLL